MAQLKEWEALYNLDDTPDDIATEVFQRLQRHTDIQFEHIVAVGTVREIFMALIIQFQAEVQSQMDMQDYMP